MATVLNPAQRKPANRPEAASHASTSRDALTGRTEKALTSGLGHRGRVFGSTGRGS
jgi:hypothetical protein